MINQVSPWAFCIKNISEIENYEEAITSKETYECHHRLETHTSDGERRKVDISKEELIALGMYYHRPANELIFLKKTDHTRLHHKNKKLSFDSRVKCCVNNGGKPIRCVETNEVLYSFQWKERSYINANSVALGLKKSCKGYHFVFEEK